MQLTLITVVNTLVLSSMYILVALGFAFLFSIMGILNFVAPPMVSGYLATKPVEWGLNQWFSLLHRSASLMLLGSS
jgi:branched-subunit amino acid ABC-type transport system permease component